VVTPMRSGQHEGETVTFSMRAASALWTDALLRACREVVDQLRAACEGKCSAGH